MKILAVLHFMINLYLKHFVRRSIYRYEQSRWSSNFSALLWRCTTYYGVVHGGVRPLHDRLITWIEDSGLFEFILGSQFDSELCYVAICRSRTVSWTILDFEYLMPLYGCAFDNIIALYKKRVPKPKLDPKSSFVSWYKKVPTFSVLYTHNQLPNTFNEKQIVIRQFAEIVLILPF